MLTKSYTELVKNKELNKYVKQIRKLLKYNDVFLCRLFQKRLQIEKIHSKTHIIHWTEHTQNDTITARNAHFFYIFMTTICIF